MGPLIEVPCKLQLKFEGGKRKKRSLDDATVSALTLEAVASIAVVVGEDEQRKDKNARTDGVSVGFS